MTQLWAIQSKLLQEDSTKFLVDAFQKLGLNWCAFPLVPFKHHVPDFAWEDGPIVYYGSTGLIRTVYSRPRLRHGTVLFFDEATHLPSWYGPRFGEQWLNHGSTIMSIEEFVRKTSTVEYGEQFDERELFFIRPNSGLKTFAGGVRSIRDFKRLRESSEGMTDADLIVVKEPVKISCEYRTWFIGGEIAAVVGYKVGDAIRPWVPTDTERNAVATYAREQGLRVTPSMAFVLDVAQTAEGFKVVEVNCIHSAGFYLTDHILDVVAELSNFIAKGYR